jgi:hypothetical protein
VPPARFQRATFRLGGGRSMQLSYGSLKENRRIKEEQSNVEIWLAQEPLRAEVSRSER